MRSLRYFEDSRRSVGALNRLPARLVPVELRTIVGSTSKSKVEMLTRDFVPRRDGTNSPRYRSVLHALRSDVPLPPIELYELKRRYYVVDGHHRVAAGRALGYLYLDALVHTYLLPETSVENRLHNEQLRFERLTGLGDIAVTDEGHFRKLLSQVREHRCFLGKAGQNVGLKTAARDWHEFVFAPIANRLTEAGVVDYFPGREVADVYVYLCDYKWVKSQNKGMDIGFPKALADFEYLYPPRPAAIAGLATVRQALRTLASPVARAGRTTQQIGADDDSDAAEGTGDGADSGGRLDAAGG